jgi:hypothetical protein
MRGRIARQSFVRLSMRSSQVAEYSSGSVVSSFVDTPRAISASPG